MTGKFSMEGPGPEPNDRRTMVTGSERASIKVCSATTSVRRLHQCAKQNNPSAAKKKDVHVDRRGYESTTKRFIKGVERTGRPSGRTVRTAHVVEALEGPDPTTTRHTANHGTCQSRETSSSSAFEHDAVKHSVLNVAQAHSTTNKKNCKATNNSGGSHVFASHHEGELHSIDIFPPAIPVREARQ